MKPEAVLCPKCNRTLLDPRTVTLHVKLATATRNHVVVHEIDCRSCHETYGMIVVADRRSYLIVLVGPERLKDEITAISQRLLEGLKPGDLWKQLKKNDVKGTVLGRRGTCRHAWKFRKVHPLAFIVLFCPRCGAETEKPLTALNLVEFVLKPYSQGDKFLRKEKEVIESAILPRKEEIIREAARELDARLKANQKRRRRLKNLRKFCGTIALVT